MSNTNKDKNKTTFCKQVVCKEDAVIMISLEECNYTTLNLETNASVVVSAKQIARAAYVHTAFTHGILFTLILHFSYPVLDDVFQFINYS